MPVGSGRKSVCPISSQNQRANTGDRDCGSSGVGVAVDREVGDRHRAVYARSATKHGTANGHVFWCRYGFIAIRKAICDRRHLNFERGNVAADGVGDGIGDDGNHAIPVERWRKGEIAIGFDQQSAYVCQCGSVSRCIARSIDSEADDGHGAIHAGRASEQVAGDRRVFRSAYRLVAIGKTIGDWRDIEVEAVGRLIRIYTAMHGAAVVFDLEGKRSHAIAIEIARGFEDQQAQLPHRNLMTGIDSSAVKQQHAICSRRQRGDDDGHECVGRVVTRITETKGRGAEGVAAVFGKRLRVVCARRRIVDRQQRDIQGGCICAGDQVSDRIGDQRHLAIPVAYRGKGVAAIGQNLQAAHAGDIGGGSGEGQYRVLGALYREVQHHYRRRAGAAVVEQVAADDGVFVPGFGFIAVIDRRQRDDVELEGVGRLIGIDTTVGGTAVVLDLEGECAKAVSCQTGLGLIDQ